MTVFWPVCTQISIAMRNLNRAIQMTVRRYFPVMHLSNHTAKSTVWMPWPLNCDLGAELRDLLTTSAYIPCAAHVQKHRKRELHACLIDRVPSRAVVFQLFQKTVILPQNPVGFRLTYTQLWDIVFIRYVSICLN